MQFMTPVTPCKTDLPEIELYIKREDLLPYSFGGNKVRIAREFFNDMDALGKNCMVGYGNTRSNLSRALANISSSRGGTCFIISPSDDDGAYIETNNSKIVNACGAKFRFCQKKNVAETVDAVMDEARMAGLDPYYIYGNKFGKGNEAVPVRAYVKVYDEICLQQKQLGVVFDYIFLPTGTGMTQGGLLAGLRKSGGSSRIIGISIARNSQKVREDITNYVNAYEKKPSNALDVQVLDSYLCGGYGKYDEKICQTIRTMMLQNGIPLDPTYTGKAFCGMCDHIKKMKIQNKKILFIHTGGTPLFFDKINLVNPA